MDTKNIRFTDKIKQNDDEFLIHEELVELISNQFEFQNIGINYLKEFDKIPTSIYDWLIQKITELYLEVDEINIVYSDINRMKIVSSSLYEFLFIDILLFKDQIDFEEDAKQLRQLTTNKLLQIKELSDSTESNEALNYNLIKWSIINDCVNNNLEMLNENYWPILIEKLQD